MLSLPNLLTLSRIVAVPLLVGLLWWPQWTLGYAIAFAHEAPQFPMRAESGLLAVGADRDVHALGGELPGFARRRAVDVILLGRDRAAGVLRGE